MDVVEETQESLNLDSGDSEQAGVSEEGQSSQSDNPELDEVVREATTTRVDAEKIERKKEDGADINPGGKSSGGIDQDEAIQIAVKGIDGYFGMVSAKVGEPIGLPNELMSLAAMACAPMVMKYGDSVRRYFKEQEVDLDSNTPEVMGGVVVLALGGYTWYSVRAVKKAEGAADGDQPQHG